MKLQIMLATWEDISKLDIRVGTILEVAPFPAARKPAFRLTIDFGLLGVRMSSAQITERYTPEGLTGRQVVAVVNLPIKKIAGFQSECLVLGISLSEKGVVLLRPDDGALNGDCLC